MKELRSGAELRRELLAAVARLNCLVFVGEEEPLGAGLAALEGALPPGAQLLLVRESDAAAEIFLQYGVERVPCFVLLNADLRPLRTLTDCSPADLAAAVAELLPAFALNAQLEQSKFDGVLGRFLLPDRFVLFAFAAALNAEFAGGRQLLQARNVAHKLMSLAPFRGEEPLTALAQIVRRVGAGCAGVPFCFANGRLFCTAAELERFLDESAELLARLAAAEAQRVEALLAKAPLLLVYDSERQGEAARAMSEELQRRQAMFAVLDCADKPGAAALLARRLGRPVEQWPCLVIDGRPAGAVETAALERFVVGSAEARARTLIASAPVFLFMKGSPEFPQCGFSRQLAELLQAKGVAFASYNVLADAELREALKLLSQWQTYPQLYVRGELVGGLDIAREMDAAGELDALLAAAKGA